MSGGCYFVTRSLMSFSLHLKTLNPKKTLIIIDPIPNLDSGIDSSQTRSHEGRTHPVPTVPVGHQHADKDEEHEDALDGQHAGPQEPGLLHPAGGAVLTAPTARPAGETDGHARVTHTAAVTPVHGATICTSSYTNPCGELMHVGLQCPKSLHVTFNVFLSSFLDGKSVSPAVV